MRIERRPRVKKPDVEHAPPAPMLRDRDRERAAFAEGATDEGVRPGIVAVGAPVMRLLAVGAAWLVAVYGRLETRFRQHCEESTLLYIAEALTLKLPARALRL